MNNDTRVLAESITLVPSEIIKFGFDIYMNDEEVGYINFEQSEAGMYCYKFFIYPAYRNQGIGSLVLRNFMCQYRNFFIAPHNADAARLYSRLGSISSELPKRYDEGFGVYKLGTLRSFRYRIFNIEVTDVSLVGFSYKISRSATGEIEESDLCMENDLALTRYINEQYFGGLS